MLPNFLLELSNRIRVLETPSAPRPRDILPLAWPELDAALPDGGLPRGVTELSSNRGLGITALALSAIRAAHIRDARAWCAWIVVSDELYAPGVAAAGVDLERLLVINPPASSAAQIAMRAANSGAFDVIVIDAFAFLQSASRSRREIPAEVFVRKLALASETHGARIVLLSDKSAPREMAWPVALRLEIDRTKDAMFVRVAKDRQGRHGATSLTKVRVPFESRPSSRIG